MNPAPPEWQQFLYEVAPLLVPVLLILATFVLFSTTT